MAYPRNRPNSSSFFVGYQPAGNLDAEPLWRLAGAKLSMRGNGQQAAAKDPTLDLEGLPNDMIDPESRFNQGAAAWRTALQKYGGDVTMAASSKEGRAASQLMSVGITERADIKRENAIWGDGSQWETLMKERSGDAYLPGDWRDFQIDKNGNIVTINDIQDLRLSPEGSIQNQRRNGQYITPTVSRGTSNDAMSFIRGTFESARSSSYGGENFDPQATGLANYYQITTSGSSNRQQIDAARNNMISTLPKDVKDGMFQAYANSQWHRAFVADYIEKPQLDENGKPIPIEEATAQYFHNTWLPNQIGNIAEEYRNADSDRSFAAIDDGNGVDQDDSGYQNWAGYVLSDVPVTDAPKSTRGISVQTAPGKYAQVQVPATELAGGPAWLSNATSIIGGEKLFEDSDDRFIPAKDIFSSYRIMINSSDGLVTDSRQSDLLESGYVLSVKNGVRMFPKGFMDIMKARLAEPGRGAPTMKEAEEIAQKLYPNPSGITLMSDPQRKAAMDAIAQERLEARNLFEAYLPILERANWKVDETPSSFAEVEIMLPSDQSGIVPGAGGWGWAESLTNHPYLKKSKAERRLPGGRVENLESGDGMFARESSGYGTEGVFDDDMPNAEMFNQRSEQISEKYGSGVAVTTVLVGLRSEDANRWTYDPDKKQGDFVDRHAAAAAATMGVQYQPSVDPAESIIR